MSLTGARPGEQQQENRRAQRRQVRQELTAPPQPAKDAEARGSVQHGETFASRCGLLFREAKGPGVVCSRRRHPPARGEGGDLGGGAGLGTWRFFAAEEGGERGDQARCWPPAKRGHLPQRAVRLL